MSLLAQRYLNPVCVIYQSEVRNSRFNICSEITAAFPVLSFSLMSIINSWDPHRQLHMLVSMSFPQLCVALSRKPWGSAQPCLHGQALTWKEIWTLCVILVWEQRETGRERWSDHSPKGDSYMHRQMILSFRLLTTQWSSHESSHTGSTQHPPPTLPLPLPMPKSPIHLVSSSKIPLATMKAVGQGQPLMG